MVESDSPSSMSQRANQALPNQVCELVSDPPPITAKAFFASSTLSARCFRFAGAVVDNGDGLVEDDDGLVEADLAGGVFEKGFVLGIRSFLRLVIEILDHFLELLLSLVEQFSGLFAFFDPFMTFPRQCDAELDAGL